MRNLSWKAVKVSATSLSCTMYVLVTLTQGPSNIKTQRVEISDISLNEDLSSHRGRDPERIQELRERLLVKLRLMSFIAHVKDVML